MFKLTAWLKRLPNSISGLNCTEIANNLGRSKSNISKEIVRNKGGRGYRPKQADRLAGERSVGSRNAIRIEPDVLKAAFERIAEQLSPEQVAAELPISHETFYQHIYADKAAGGALGKNLRCQKKRKKGTPVGLSAEVKSWVDVLFTNVLQMLSCAALLGTGRAIR